MENSSATPGLSLQPTADGSDTLYSAQYRQTFHSTHGALIEAEHVFLNGAGGRARLDAGQPTRVLEVGFGTGLNFLLTAHHSRLAETALHYVSLEKNLLPAKTLDQLNHGQMLPAAADIRQAFLQWRAGLPQLAPPAKFRWDFVDLLVLDLAIGDATQGPIPNLGFHAVYHDAFSPDANPELWTPEFFARLFNVLAPGGKLATYSVKGAVRRALQAVGFKVQKQPGPPGKREMLVALKPPTDSA